MYICYYLKDACDGLCFIMWLSHHHLLLVVISVKGKKGKDVTCGQVCWPILRNCALHLTHPRCTHTAVSSEQTHTQQWTHTRSSGHTSTLRRPGSSWGFGALLKGLTSVVVLRVERALDIAIKPCRPWDSNLRPLVYKSDSLSIRTRLAPLYYKGTRFQFFTKFLFFYFTFLCI